MKTIVLSDVNSKWESVIPYGLRVGRAFESEVDVVYVIDTRLQQGEYTPYSDSQSITPGNKLSQSEVVQREQNRAELQLDKLLSSEASRLNFPLKVNRVIKENSIVDELIQLTSENPDCLLVMSAEPDNYVFESKDDILTILQEAGVAALLVPPRKDFKDFERILLPVDFSSEQFKPFTNFKFLFNRFNPLIDAVSVVPKGKYADEEMKGEAWKKTASDYFVDTTLKINTLEGEDFADTLIAYAQRNKPDLVILFQEKVNSKGKLANKKEITTLLNELEIPVLIHYHNNKN